MDEESQREGASKGIHINVKEYVLHSVIADLRLLYSPLMVLVAILPLRSINKVKDYFLSGHV